MFGDPLTRYQIKGDGEFAAGQKERLMKRRLATLMAALGSGVAIAVLTAAPAHADPAGYACGTRSTSTTVSATCWAPVNSWSFAVAVSCSDGSVQYGNQVPVNSGRWSTGACVSSSVLGSWIKWIPASTA
jgi:hypothetical protein